ncbi:MAG: sulfurtransferase TusA family protein [Alphaproteobacteria bacterium GM202ARS2]|nr:sulfurtransferase TusA family protein [Alphaproteobacteria bacterium GM202ARS2]
MSRACTTILDVKGLRCPLPVLKAHKALSSLAVGDTLEVLTTDESAPKDLRIYCANSGNQLVECQERNEEGLRFFSVVLRRC